MSSEHLLEAFSVHPLLGFGELQRGKVFVKDIQV